MSSHSDRSDPSLRDLAWSGYHPRALAPAVILVAVLSLAVWTGRWYLDDFSEFADRVGTLAVFAMAWAVWPALLAVLLYRTVTFTYRLTDRALLVDYGFLSPPVTPIDLVAVKTVVVLGGWKSRWLRVGSIEIQTEDRIVRLRGVRQPETFALMIREVAERAKGAESGGAQAACSSSSV
jgi:hypothetical protein